MREGGNVQQWQYANQPNQNWEVIDLGQNSVAIIAQHSGMALTVDGTGNGANVVQRRWRNNNSRQQWSMQPVGGEWYQIRNVSSGRCLDVSARSTADGANIQQWNCAGADNQHFRLAGGQGQPPPTQPPSSGSFPVIYAQQNFQGPARAVERDFPGDVDWEGNPHLIRSIRVPPGWQLVVYERRNYRGRSMTLESDWSPSRGDSWYGRVRSIRVTRAYQQPR